MLVGILKLTTFRTRRPEVFLGKGVLKICNKVTGEHLSRSVISIKLQSNFMKITLLVGCSRVNLLHIFRTPFPKNTSGSLVLNVVNFKIPTSKDLPFQSNNTSTLKIFYEKTFARKLLSVKFRL